MRITILGCGAAPGVPSVSRGWGRCDPANPRNRRRRASVLVSEGDAALLIDASPDLRDQLLDARVRRLDAVLFTHGHADHIHGLDELREVNRIMRGPIPVFGDAETLRTLETRFGYAFEGIAPGAPVYRPWLVPTVVGADAFTAAGMVVRAFPQDHGFSTTLGFRIGDFAYSTDVLDLGEEAFALLEGLSVWIVGALQELPHPTHAHLDKVLGWIARVKPRRAIITHMSNDLDYDALMRRLPVGVTAGFDGLQVEVESPPPAAVALR
jgi:phosphoribosyl 1,2-cyclic phosphate phosphodiesterase